MKRFSLALVLAAVVACLTISSCSLFGVEGPQDTWCPAEVTYDGVKLQCWIMFSEDEYKTTKSNNMATDVEIPAGLTIIVAPGKGSASNQFIPANTYLKKNLALGTKVVEANEADGEDTESLNLGAAIGQGTWNLMYVAGYMAKDTDWGETSSVVAPVPIQKGSNYEEGSSETISWKKILAGILVNYLAD